MLSDEQIDQLEVALLTGKLQDLPTMLTQWLPVLFSELRVCREALREVLEERLDAIAGTATGSAGGVPVRDVNRTVPEEVLETERDQREVLPVVERTDTASVQASPNTRAKRSRKRSRKDKAAVVGGSDQQAMGGEIREGSEVNDERFIAEVLEEL